MITHATRPPQSLQCDVLILTELVHTIRKPIHNVNESVCHVKTPSKESHSKYADCGRKQDPKCLKMVPQLCTVCIWWRDKSSISCQGVSLCCSGHGPILTWTELSGWEAQCPRNKGAGSSPGGSIRE